MSLLYVVSTIWRKYLLFTDLDSRLAITLSSTNSSCLDEYWKQQSSALVDHLLNRVGGGQ